ncbi:MAG: type II secretion system protein [Patescibacteria group bacterium]
MRSPQGFSRTDTTVVLGLIAIIAVILLATLNPAARFQEARDAKRWSDAENILEAIKQAQIENGGSYPASVANTAANKLYQIGTAESGCDTGCGDFVTEPTCVNLTDLVNQGQLTEVPLAPGMYSDAMTGYYLIRKLSGSLEVGACDPGQTENISVSR